ncbi:MAG: hypothetical protein VB674_04510, partial [Vicinamibacterales bacterium]
MGYTVLLVLLLAFLPGTILLRCSSSFRQASAVLSTEERLFWSVAISLTFSSVTALILAAFGTYDIDYLAFINGTITLALTLASQGHLKLQEATQPTRTVLAPLLLIGLALGTFFYVPPAEYIIGGRDPGVYVNAGVQISQRDSLIIEDSVVRTVPREYRHLFFPPRTNPRERGYDSVRFMGFFILDPSVGTVVGQFPHLYPVWIAIAYDVYGLTGVRYVLGLWAIFGVLAIYFVGAQLLGRTAAFAGAGLLTLHVAQVWYARYPNAEIIMQALIFTGLLAYARAHSSQSRLFATTAAVTIGLSLFAHITAVLAVAGTGLAALLGRASGHRIRFDFLLPLALITVIAGGYYVEILEPYAARPIMFINDLQLTHLPIIVSGALAMLLVVIALRQPKYAAIAQRWGPRIFIALIWIFACYALFFRTAGGTLAVHDADGLRTFTNYYLLPLGLATALLGWTIIAGHNFWTGSAFHFVGAIFMFFIFYKARVVPEHFWMARRFLPVILPVSLLLIGAAAFTRTSAHSWLPVSWLNTRTNYLFRAALGVLVIGWLGAQYLHNTQPILRHSEFSGLIPKLEELAARFTPDDLVLVESRGSSDMHLLATPLEYIYDRNVLVFDQVTPHKQSFRRFVEWARTTYDRVFFIGGGGTDLLSKSTVATTVGADRFQVPEYEQTLNAYPTTVRHKEFDYGIYEFVPGRMTSGVFDLDVGTADDLYVRRIHAKQQDHNGVTYRWTRDRSFISVLGTLATASSLTLYLNNGGRPDDAEETHVHLTLDNTPL